MLLREQVAIKLSCKPRLTLPSLQSRSLQLLLIATETLRTLKQENLKKKNPNRYLFFINNLIDSYVKSYFFDIFFVFVSRILN